MKYSSDEKFLKVFGKQIARLRRSRGLTQEGLAEKANLAPRSIQAIENGLRWPRPSTLLILSDALEIPLSKIFKDL